MKEISTLLKDDTETEVTFRPSAETASKSQKRKLDSDNNEEVSNKRFALMFGDKCVAAARKQLTSTKKDEITMEIERYQAELCLEMDECPLNWWSLNAPRYPFLSTVAKKYLGIPASAVPCERLFSQAGQIITKQRAKMAPGTAEMTVFMKAYYNSQ